jgi:hypothetical protein
MFLFRASRFARMGPVGVAFAGYELWRRLSPQQRQAIRARAAVVAGGVRSRLGTDEMAQPSREETRMTDSEESGAGEAVKRDWEQTKSDLPGLDGDDLGQDADDTVKQATGKESTPPDGQPNRS